MKDERFLHPMHMLDGRTGQLRVVVFFRKRNHLIPCSTRAMKSQRKQLTRATFRWEADVRRRMATGEHFSILPSSMHCDCGHCVESILAKQSPGVPVGVASMAAHIRREVARPGFVSDADLETDCKIW